MPLVSRWLLAPTAEHLGILYKMEIKDINDIVPTKSYNLGTQKGCRVLKRSLKELGCCRSIVVDRNNKVLIGNKTLDAAKLNGITKVIIVETTGNELVVVKRKDIDADTRKAQEINIVDNLTSDLNLNYDTNFILEQMNQVWGFDPRYWEGHSCLVQELSVEDCIKEGVAAVEKRDTQNSVEIQKQEETITQLSLF